MEKTKVKIFKDSVHGYINVPTWYAKCLIDNKYFQRLRNIEQTGMRVLYPAAKHDRFSHSLGVFHLGQKAVEALRADVDDSIFTSEEFDRYEILFLTACMLHDIGHTPFSHSLEDQILENSILREHQKGRRAKNDIEKRINVRLTEIINENEALYCAANDIQQSKVVEVKAASHEILGSYLIFEQFALNIKGLEEKYGIWKDDIVFGDDICFIVRMIMGIKYEEFSPKRQARNCFIELLNGDNFDVDKLDYIVRDTQMSGIDNVVVDVERLLGALCVVTKTKHLNKVNLEKSDIQNLTISSISNVRRGECEIDGNFKGIIKIRKGSEVEVRKGSKIEFLKGVEHDLAEVAYVKNDQAVFSATTWLKQDSDWVNAQEMSDYHENVKLLTGKTNNQKFGVYIENAEVKKDLKIEAQSDLEIHIFGQGSIKIKGQFESIGSLKLFSCRKLCGSISEVEILGNTFEKDFTSSKTPSEHGYNTYSIGFKKQAINVIANVLEARNYLYLWVYAHHKVIYYANFLIPVIAKEIAQHCGKGNSSFPSWELCYDNLDKLDDYYIWTAIKFVHSAGRPAKLKKEYADLIEQLFSRVYNRSLYKSLAEFELVYDSFTVKQKLAALGTLQTQTDSTKPFLGDKRNKNFLAGYLKSDAIADINAKIKEIAADTGKSVPEINLSQVIYVVTEFKQKTLNPDSVYLDMIDEILPISQIPLLSGNRIVNNGAKEKYFYVYYKDDAAETSIEKTRIIKDAIKKYLSN
ncbi:MAG: HD domain-containing protein [Bacilli bacterium]|nr:HD domain-containing protein [Bacilli bacterium]